MHTTAETASFPVLDLPPPASVDDFSMSFLVNEDSNSGYGFNLNFGASINERMIWYHGFRTFLDQQARDIPPGTRHVKGFYDPESIKTARDKEVIQSRKQEYGRVYTKVVNHLNTMLHNDFTGPEADFRIEDMMDKDCVWVIYLEKLNPVLSFVISFDKLMYDACFENYPEASRREWYLTFSKEMRLTKIYPLIPQCLEEMQNAQLNLPGMPRYRLMLPTINPKRQYFVVECYFVNNENINPVDKSFLNSNTANLGFDILHDNIPESTAQTTLRRKEPETEEMQVDTAPSSSLFSDYIPHETQEQVPKKRGKKATGPEIKSQIVSNYHHLFSHFVSKTASQVKKKSTQFNLHDMDDESDGTLRVHDPNFPKKVEFLRNIMDNTIYIAAVDYVSTQILEKEFLKIQNKGERSERDMKTFKTTIRDVLQTSFRQATAQKNQKKKEIADSTPAAWSTFLSEHLAKPTTFFKSYQTFAAIFEDVTKVAHLLCTDPPPVCQWSEIQPNDITSTTTCLLTKIRITPDICQQGIKMFISTSQTSTSLSGFSFYLRYAGMKSIFLALVRNICIWKNVIFPIIHTHIQHNFHLFQKTSPASGDSIDDSMIELQIISFFTDYSINPQNPEPAWMVTQSVKQPSLRDDLKLMCANIEKETKFTPINDLINICVAILLEAIKTLAYFKNITLQILEKNQ